MKIENLKEYEAFVVAKLNPKALNSHTDMVACAALGLSGESGEVADIIKKHLFQDRPYDLAELVNELGDTLFYLTMLCLAVNVPLERIIEQNVEKLNARYPTGYTKR